MAGVDLAGGEQEVMRSKREGGACYGVRQVTGSTCTFYC